MLSRGWCVALAAVFATTSLQAMAGCHQPGPEKPLPADVNERWQNDSAAYARRLVKWRRDSAVVDSVARSVDTDSLYGLYRRVLSARSSAEVASVFQLIYCEGIHLGVKYGAVPSDIAIQRMQDTVYRDRGIRDPVRYIGSRLPADGLAEGSKCGKFGPRRDRVGDVPLNVIIPKPRLPVRPKP